METNRIIERHLVLVENFLEDMAKLSEEDIQKVFDLRKEEQELQQHIVNSHSRRYAISKEISEILGYINKEENEITS